MGAATSTGLVEAVRNGDIQLVRQLLHRHEATVQNAPAAPNDALWQLEVREAVHTVVASDLKSERQLQQQQIALELLLHTRPEAWSTVTINEDLSDVSNAISVTKNSADWTASHQACAAGNLAFVVFVLQHYPAQFDIQTRDAFGLFPIDLVPPELFSSAEEIADDFRDERDAMEHERSCTLQSLVLKRLRERKAKLQDEHVRRLVKTSTIENVDNQDEDTCKPCEFYIAFEPTCKQLPYHQIQNKRHVHERSKLLRVSYRLPRSDPFLNGYFQLIWRENGDAWSEEPHYDPHVTKLSDECARYMEKEALWSPQHNSTSRFLELSNLKSVVEGYLLLDVTHLPVDSVCHVLFITCDRRLLHRTVELSTESLALHVTNFSSDVSSSTSEEELTEKDFEGQNQENAKQIDNLFFVGGEEFLHPNPVFAGQNFPDVDAFESFLKDLRAKKQRRRQDKINLLGRPKQESNSDGSAKQEQSGKMSPPAIMVEEEDNQGDNDTARE